VNDIGRHWAVPVGAGAALGVVFASAPSFSGLALLSVLLVGAVVGFGLLTAPYPVSEVPRPGWPILRRWLVWALVAVGLEAAVLLAGDDLRWPTFSSMQDALTSEHSMGRFLAGTAWTAAGFGLLTMANRYRGDDARSTIRGRATAYGSAGTLVVLAVRSVGDGPMLIARDPQSDAVVGAGPMSQWPATAWATVAVFFALLSAGLLLLIRGRSAAPPAALPDLLAWLMAPWAGRVLGFTVWLWCGWHFLAR
jgi:hypothetical protein